MPFFTDTSADSFMSKTADVVSLTNFTITDIKECHWWPLMISINIILLIDKGTHITQWLNSNFIIKSS
jgi:hypothetical protein